jgi:hypothetical protein
MAMEVRLSIDDEFLKVLQEKIGSPATAADLTREALTMLNWAIEEVADGRVVLSTNAAGEEVRRLVMPTLLRAQQTAQQKGKTGGAPTDEAACPSFSA